MDVEPENKLMAEPFFLSSLRTALRLVLIVVALEPGGGPLSTSLTWRLLKAGTPIFNTHLIYDYVNERKLLYSSTKFRITFRNILLKLPASENTIYFSVNVITVCSVTCVQWVDTIHSYILSIHYHLWKSLKCMKCTQSHMVLGLTLLWVGLTSMTFVEAPPILAILSWRTASLRVYSRELRANAMIEVGSCS